MIQLLTYHDIDQQQWRSLINQSPTATWFQTPEAYAFYASLPEEMTPFAVGVVEECKASQWASSDLKVLNDLKDGSTDRLAGVIVGYITREKNSLKQFFTRRAIIVGGPLLADDISDEALSALLKAAAQFKVESLKCKGKATSEAVTSALTPYTLHPTPIYIESRNFHDYSRWKYTFEQNGFVYQPHYDIHVHCNADHQMSERRQRELKRAIKNGATVAEAQTEQEIRDWYQILNRLYREKVRTPLFSEEFFLQFYRNGVGKYLLVKADDKVIGGMMCPILDGRAIYEWYVCGLDEEYRELSPSVVATAAAINYAKVHGLSLFDFMGAGQPDVPYGVRDFKLEFGGELVEYGRFLCIRKPLLYWLGNLGVKLLKMKR